MSTRCYGPHQSSILGELDALKHLLDVWWRPTIAITDSKFVHDAFQLILYEILPTGPHHDFFIECERIVAARACAKQQTRRNLFAAYWIPSHLTIEAATTACIPLTFWLANKDADDLATKGAAAHGLPQHIANRYKQQAQDIKILHSVALAIFHERVETRPLPSCATSSTAAQLSKLKPNPLWT